jgi:hypothetical protein
MCLRVMEDQAVIAVLAATGTATLGLDGLDEVADTLSMGFR